MFEALHRSNSFEPLQKNDPRKTNSDYIFALEELVVTAQELLQCRSFEDILSVARIAGRQLTGADGATFVLKDDDKCYYVEENAIGPLWKGKKFPLNMCISGWVMMNREAAAIEDIYKDARIPHDAYRPTFVKSLVMVPVRKNNPVAAIGNYWSHHHRPSEHEISILQMLADTVAVAMENVKHHDKLQGQLKAHQ